MRDVGTLTQFVIDNSYKMQTGYADSSLAKANNGTYVTCQTNPYDMVIALKYGTKTSIVTDGGCNTITVNSCDGLLNAVEKFEVQSVKECQKQNKYCLIFLYSNKNIKANDKDTYNYKN